MVAGNNQLGDRQEDPGIHACMSVLGRATTPGTHSVALRPYTNMTEGS